MDKTVEQILMALWDYLDTNTNEVDTDQVPDYLLKVVLMNGITYVLKYIEKLEQINQSHNPTQKNKTHKKL